MADGRVLVTAGSKHGATAEIANHIGATLRERGFQVTVAAPDDVISLKGYHVVVLGSGVYAGHWLKDAKRVAKQVAETAPPPKVWLFSSGPLGTPPEEEDPVDVKAIEEETAARGHRIFSGKIDKSLLSFGERAIMVAVRAPEGDFRDWEDIAEWADEIADQLGAEEGQLDTGT